MSTGTSANPTTSPAEPLRDAFQQTHNAVQWLARVSKSFRSEAGAESTDLQWDQSRNAFVTSKFANGLQMELRLPELALQFLENGNPVKHELQMEGRSPAHVEAWLLVELLHRGLDRERFSTELPYAIANPMTGDDIEYSPETRAEELKQIISWFAAAAEVMRTLLQESGGKSSADSMFLVAKNFALEAKIPVAGQGSVADRAIRVGFCPLRQGVVDPHYFVARFEPTKKGSEVIEIVKVSGQSPTDIAGPAITERLMAVVEKAQRRAAN